MIEDFLRIPDPTLEKFVWTFLQVYQTMIKHLKKRKLNLL